MKCPYCGCIENRVIDSRLSLAGEVTRRRRECLECERRYTTYERIELALPMVVKKDRRREPFDREKLLAGIRRACVKRPIAWEKIDKLVSDVEKEIAESGEKEVASSKVGELVMAGLRELDQVAYVRFASVYRSFKDIHEFMDELSDLLSTETSRG
ncbi:MAG: transcriptional repressor NrdR [Deltaproteobacteria bacterium]|nr:transcriptional repressor NrdR [Deltaproteobacteria bacterium]